MFDLTLGEKGILFTFDPIFFDSMFKKRWETSPLVLENKAYKKYGTFYTGEKYLGFGQGIELLSSNVDCIQYIWRFPAQEWRDCLCFDKTQNCSRCDNKRGSFGVNTYNLRELLISINLLFQYEIDVRFFMPTQAPKQTLSLNLSCWYDDSHGANLGGWIYPPLVSFLDEISQEDIMKLGSYVQSEMTKIYVYIYGLKTNSIRGEIVPGKFYMEVPGSATYVAITNSDRSYKGKQEFSSHNVDHSSQQFCLVVGIIALNTFYRRWAELR